MQIQLVPVKTNQHPLRGLLIRGSLPYEWMRALQLLGVSLSAAKLYPLPGTRPNSVWGCLLALDSEIGSAASGHHERCQVIGGRVFIPERAALYPVVTEQEFLKLFGSGIHVAHPDFGWVEVKEPLSIATLLSDIRVIRENIIQPISSVRLPFGIRSFQVMPSKPEEVLKKMEQELFPQQKQLDDKPLNVLEKLRLGVYRRLFGKSDNGGNPTSTGGKFIQKVLGKNWSGVNRDMQELEDRNKKTVDKLLEMLRKDPSKALQYAPPLDQGGETRGGTMEGSFTLNKWWNDLGLFGNNPRQSGKGGALNLGNSYYDLQRQYLATADQMVKEGDFRQAAFVYMKLLKQHYRAGEVLEMGEHYQEAGTVFLKFASNKKRAAECFEKGSLIDDALPLYKELGEHEKVGDLYVRKADRGQAMVYYEKVLDKHRESGQYIKAAELSQTKMGNFARGQSLLLQGWREHREGPACLSRYFTNIQEPELLLKSIQDVYRDDLNEKSTADFLRVIGGEYRAKRTDVNPIREIAYEIVERRMTFNPHIVTELKNFSDYNRELDKDLVRFRSMNRHSPGSIVYALQQKYP